MEAVTIGLPMVFFNAIPGQEEANAELLEQRGCARWARDIHNLEDVVTALLINLPRLQQTEALNAQSHHNFSTMVGDEPMPNTQHDKNVEHTDDKKVVGVLCVFCAASCLLKPVN